MDANKRQVLQNLGYKIRPSCGQCKHGDFTFTDWGTCKATTYKHLKHTDEVRQLSIYRYGVCPGFQAVDVPEVALDKFAEFWRDNV